MLFDPTGSPRTNEKTVKHNKESNHSVLDYLKGKDAKGEPGALWEFAQKVYSLATKKGIRSDEAQSNPRDQTMKNFATLGRLTAKAVVFDVALVEMMKEAEMKRGE